MQASQLGAAFDSALRGGVRDGEQDGAAAGVSALSNPLMLSSGDVSSFSKAPHRQSAPVAPSSSSSVPASQSFPREGKNVATATSIQEALDAFDAVASDFRQRGSLSMQRLVTGTGSGGRPSSSGDGNSRDGEELPDSSMATSTPTATANYPKPTRPSTASASSSSGALLSPSPSSVESLQSLLRRLAERNRVLQRQLQSTTQELERVRTGAAVQGTAGASGRIDGYASTKLNSAADDALQAEVAMMLANTTTTSSSSSTPTSTSHMNTRPMTAASSSSSSSSSLTPNSSSGSAPPPRSEDVKFVRAHLGFLLQQRDRQIDDLKSERDLLQATVIQLEDAVKRGGLNTNRTNSIHPTTSASSSTSSSSSSFSSSSGAVGVRGAGGVPHQLSPALTAQYEQAYRELRQTFHARLSERLANLQVSTKIPRQVLYLLTQLQSALISEATARQIERMMLNSRLLQMEQEVCDRYVGYQLLERKLARCNEEITRLKATERKAEETLFTLLDRCKGLEQERAAGLWGARQQQQQQQQSYPRSPSASFDAG